MSSKKSDTFLEDITTDARVADGYVVLFKYKNMTGFLAVPATPPRSSGLRKLLNAVKDHPRLSVALEGFEIGVRKVGQGAESNVFDIKFAVRNGDDVEPILLFLEYLKQCRVISNPIVSDIRRFKIK